MPELPEVQTVVDGLNKKIKSKTIKDIWTDYKSNFYRGKDNIKDPAFFRKFKKAVMGARVLEVKRRAKNIFIHLDNGKVILVHLKMTGHFLYGDYFYDKKEKTYKPKGGWIERGEIKKNPSLKKKIEKEPLRDPFNKFIHFAIIFSDGKVLALSDMRKFATVSLLNKEEIEEKIISKIGPEPFDLKPAEFAKMAKKARGKIKTVLMKPEFIAGIGNIYSDEILWKVEVHPESEISKVPSFKLKEIIKFAKKILKKSISVGGDSMSDFRNIDGRRGRFQNSHKCYKLENTVCQKSDCDAILRKKNVGSRVARYCPKHQKLYK